MTQFAYTILYVENVRQSLSFYQQIFGFRIRFLHESGDFGELDTGSTSLAFSSQKLMSELKKNPSRANANAPCFEIAFATEDVEATLQKALAAGAELIQEPEVMDWGQTVAYVADLDNNLIEICTPMGR